MNSRRQMLRSSFRQLSDSQINPAKIFCQVYYAGERYIKCSNQPAVCILPSTLILTSWSQFSCRWQSWPTKMSMRNCHHQHRSSENQMTIKKTCKNYMEIQHWATSSNWNIFFEGNTKYKCADTTTLVQDSYCRYVSHNDPGSWIRVKMTLHELFPSTVI